MPPRHRAVTAAVTMAATSVGRATLARVVVGLILVSFFKKPEPKRETWTY